MMASSDSLQQPTCEAARSPRGARRAGHGAGAPALVSVIIPVWNDAGGLRRCLSALEAQTYPRESLQVLVVDNGSDDDSRAVAASFPFVTILDEARPGSYCARNRGLAEADGEFVAFIDSDCEPAPGWLAAAIAAAHAETPPVIVAGHIELICAPEEADSPAAAYEALFAFDQGARAAEGHCVTANWVCRRDLILDFGGFDDRLSSGADTELARRMAAAGHAIVYAPEATVGHPARASLAELVAKRRRLVGGRWQAARGRASTPKLAMQLFRQFAGEARHTVRARHMTVRRRIGALAAIAVLWTAAMLELVRLSLGGTPRRS